MRILLTTIVMTLLLAGCQSQNPTVNQERTLDRTYMNQDRAKVPTESLKAVRAI